MHLGDRCLLPGFVEAHGHAITEARLFGTDLVDIRPMTVPTADEVVAVIRKTVTARGTDGAAFIGWDPLGHGADLPEPTRAWLDAMAPDTPMVILTQAVHLAFFNSAPRRTVRASAAAPRTRPGARFGQLADGTPDGTRARRGGDPGSCLAGRGDPREEFTAATLREMARLSQVGGDDGQRDGVHARVAPRPPRHGAGGCAPAGAAVRLYSPSETTPTQGRRPGEGTDLTREIGVKVWVDGSPFVGSIAASFPLPGHAADPPPGLRDTAARHGELLVGRARRDRRAPTCRSAGKWPATRTGTWRSTWSSTRTRASCPAIRAATTGCASNTPGRCGTTSSPGRGGARGDGERVHRPRLLLGRRADRRPVRPRLRVALGGRPVRRRRGYAHLPAQRSPATPEDPLHNITVATTRRSRTGRLLAPEECLTVDQALRAQTIDAAYQLFCDDITGSLTPGKYADLVVLSADPRRVAPERIEDIDVLATFLAGRQVFGEALV
ncbi:amidohydrolase family protein [Yinghuangia aomiensis]